MCDSHVFVLLLMNSYFNWAKNQTVWRRKICIIRVILNSHQFVPLTPNNGAGCKWHTSVYLYNVTECKIIFDYATISLGCLTFECKFSGNIFQHVFLFMILGEVHCVVWASFNVALSCCTGKLTVTVVLATRLNLFFLLISIIAV